MGMMADKGRQHPTCQFPVFNFFPRGTQCRGKKELFEVLKTRNSGILHQENVKVVIVNTQERNVNIRTFH